FRNTVIVVSHDRHFLDTVCTNIADIDFSKINIYTGNYTFWYETSQLALRQKQNANKKAEDKVKELQTFIARFSANASKSKQATSRQKRLDKINIEDIKPSSRRYPAIIFNQEREAGNQILNAEGLSKKFNGEYLFKNVDLNLRNGDKVAFLGDSMAISMFFDVLMGEQKADEGHFKFGDTITTAYLPLNNEPFFNTNLNLIDWLRQYSVNKDEVYVRGFLGKMLFTGEESFKSASVLSGGEKVRCMTSKMMLAQGNLLILDEPTNHLDLESITAFNNGLKAFPGTVLFTSHDHEFTNTVANRIIELKPESYQDKEMTYDEFLEKKKMQLVQS
ncbi:MAG: ATPase subunit of ABC transporter with duplicated ATPase domains, partial [Gammaproteobacteria bacterium]